MMKKIGTVLLGAVLSLSILFPSASFAASTYKVVPGDTLWKIAVKTTTGIDEIIKANLQIPNINIIYPGQKINIPSNNGYSAEQEVIQLVNQERAKQGLPALKYDWELARVAEHKSQDMRNKKYFSHTSPTYGSPFDMMRAYVIQYKAAGENIAMGQRSAKEVVNAWMNSSGHRANILNANFTHIGVGYVEDGHYWTQMFIKK
ncbi:CAP domain-containing protein [Niallia sp. XMNu-256]|uniref:CAP domain-containing protein n=1 Tax=Niallia sp. XMNu-256 TaxID=3082444 RepID=UPI0030CFDE84